MPPLILFDVSNIAWRSHFAFNNLSCDEGPTGVLYGFLNSVLRLRKNFSKRIIFCWDNGIPSGAKVAPLPSWRKAIFPEYKGTRSHDQEAFEVVMGQMRKLYDVLTWMGYQSLGAPGIEADDMISICAQEAVRARCSVCGYTQTPAHLDHYLCKGWIPSGPRTSVLVFSGDGDMYQLLTKDNSIRVLLPGNGSTRIVDAADVETEFGIPISMWPAYLAMGGDKSDNIKPRKGMGPKTALKLIHSGAYPPMSYDKLPDKVKAKYDSECWDRVCAAFKVAKLPQFVHELPEPYAQNLQLPNLDGRPRWRSRAEVEASYRRFTTFCADHLLKEHMAARRQFFPDKIV